MKLDDTQDPFSSAVRGPSIDIVVSWREIAVPDAILRALRFGWLFCRCHKMFFTDLRWLDVDPPSIHERVVWNILATIDPKLSIGAIANRFISTVSNTLVFGTGTSTMNHAYVARRCWRICG